MPKDSLSGTSLSQSPWLLPPPEVNMSPSVVLESPPPPASRTSANPSQAPNPTCKPPTSRGHLRCKLLPHQPTAFLYPCEISAPWTIHPNSRARLHIANGKEGLAVGT
ncbi:hypothetical protein L873DRAFT_1806759 [Choiromyces venosus 120613-1]|uniref:Uncharacterized protein n=1 Tax=Choiromyces venosus 120613-1 TaxID=1336337 RepID=A0A3N4JR13_9PEZI|nr:hypothetical protein L873DRAFT_1806759 [Choiromyces venosus 120613-1]